MYHIYYYNNISFSNSFTPFYISNADFNSKKIKKCKINSRNFTYDGITFSSSGFSLWEEEVKDEI
jgi:hypothetical protein